MRILILSANTGEGHNSAARAMEQHFTSLGCQCRVVDGLSFLSRSRNALICKGHVFFYRRLPRVYGMGYRFEEIQAQRRRYQTRLKTRAARLRKRHLSRHREALKELLNSGAYDAVICVHVFAARLVSELRCSGQASIPAYFLATDYTCSPGVNQLDMDAWLIPHPALKPEFISFGIPKEKIIPTGIPIGEAFLRRRDKITVRRELNLPEDKNIVLISCGSMGAGHMDKMVASLLEILPENALVIAVCGSNRSLTEELKNLFPGENLMVLGFTSRMHDYMDAADVFLTKPGGLSITEAVHKRVPLLLINAVPGVETRNLEFMRSLGCAASAQDIPALAQLCAEALASPEIRRALTENCLREFADHAAAEIHRAIKPS